MGIDVVDIGGAARGGVPVIPPARDADGDSEDEGELLTQPIPPRDQQIPLAVQKSVVPGATVAYPNTHPAVTSGLQQDSEGRLIVPKGAVLTPNSVLTMPRKPKINKQREENSKQLDELLSTEEQDTPASAPVAKSETGIPLIEVVFQTSLGAIVSYFHKVVQSGNWLILVSDNRAAAQSKFIPRPVENPDGTHLVFDMMVTGADKRTQNLRAMPLGIQFTVDTYDFVVMMLAQPEES